VVDAVESHGCARNYISAGVKSPGGLKHGSPPARNGGVHAFSTGRNAAVGMPARGWTAPRDEAGLISAAKGGSADAVEALVRRYWDEAHRTAFLIVHDAAAAEDIAQEAVLAAVRRIDDFDRRRPFRPWLHRIVVNRSLDWLRKRRHEVHVNEPAAVAAPEPGLPGEAMTALARLEPELRALIVMRHLHGYRSSELAHMLGLPAATVRTRLARALERLEALLERETP
jgi:RNA polymerase sigma-70 factor (ECF subfamily)